MVDGKCQLEGENGQRLEESTSSEAAVLYTITACKVNMAVLPTSKSRKKWSSWFTNRKLNDNYELEKLLGGEVTLQT